MWHVYITICRSDAFLNFGTLSPLLPIVLMVADMVVQGGLVVDTEVAIPWVLPLIVAAVEEAVVVPVHEPHQALAALPDAEPCFKMWTALSQDCRVSLSQYIDPLYFSFFLLKDVSALKI